MPVHRVRALIVSLLPQQLRSALRRCFPRPAQPVEPVSIAPQPMVGSAIDAASHNAALISYCLTQISRLQADARLTREIGEEVSEQQKALNDAVIRLMNLENRIDVMTSVDHAAPLNALHASLLQDVSRLSLELFAATARVAELERELRALKGAPDRLP